MAQHNTVVRRLVHYYEKQGLYVMAEVRGRKRPPKAYGRRGAVYYADVFVPKIGLAIEVKEDGAARYAGPKLKAIQDAPEVTQCVLVTCTGSPAGIPSLRRRLRKEGVRCQVVNYKELPLR
jgi:hypothetical protein